MMKKLIPAIAVLTIGATSAFAQTTPAPTTPAPTPPAQTTPPTTTPPSNVPVVPATPPSQDTMTEAQAKAWIDKAVYSSDGSNIGSVAELRLDSSGKISELNADIGGFLGLGQTRVRVMPSQFKLAGDRVVLTLTSAQTKELPKVTK